MNPAHNGVRSGFMGNPMLRRCTATPAIALALLFSASALSADPILIPTAGAVAAGGPGGTANGFTFVGRTFSIGGLHVVWEPLEQCAPCAPGTNLNLSSTVTMIPGPLGFAHIDGVVSTQPVDFIGTFAFDAGSVLVPDVASGATGSASSRFTFTGTLAGFADADLSETLLFSTTIAGGGTARLQFFNTGAGVMIDQIVYEIQDPAATPEPASLLLIGSGGAFLAAYRRRGRRRHD